MNPGSHDSCGSGGSIYFLHMTSGGVKPSMETALSQYVPTGKKKYSLRDTGSFIGEVERNIDTTIKHLSSPPLSNMTIEHFSSIGKYLRSYLAKEVAISLEANLEYVSYWASVCELLHNATLVHDDIQDGDEIRRNSPTMWKVFGMEQAINIGDFLLVAAPYMLHKLPPDLEIKLQRIFIKMSCNMVNGQSFEFVLNKLSLQKNLKEDYIECAKGKTAALFGGIARGVSIIKGSPEDEREGLASIFEQLGIIFQIYDDLLDLYGDKKRDISGNDIKEGKVSILVAIHLSNHPTDYNFIKAILRKDRNLTTESDIRQIVDLFQNSGTKKEAFTLLNKRLKKLQNHSYFKINPNLKSVIDKIIATQFFSFEGTIQFNPKCTKSASLQ